MAILVECNKCNKPIKDPARVLFKMSDGSHLVTALCRQTCAKDIDAQAVKDIYENVKRQWEAEFPQTRLTDAQKASYRERYFNLKIKKVVR